MLHFRQQLWLRALATAISFLTVANGRGAEPPDQLKDPISRLAATRPTTSPTAHELDPVFYSTYLSPRKLSVDQLTAFSAIASKLKPVGRHVWFTVVLSNSRPLF